MSGQLTKQKITVAHIREMKRKGEKITMLTAYDAGFAGMIDSCGIDVVLVGDSLGMVLLGYESTVPVTMDEMLHHAKAASKGLQRSLLVGDMPFLSYQVDPVSAVANAGRFMKEAGCDAVKIEGGVEICDTVRRLVSSGIPVMGHIGLTPQTAGMLGGFRVQGRDLESARAILNDAKALDDAGVFALVLECVPEQLAELITETVSVPTIGIGAGSMCDGQVLVTHDLIGMYEKFVPSFVKQYTKVAPQIKDAFAAFRDEVREGGFPGKEHSFTMQADLRALLKESGSEEAGEG